MPRLLRVQSEGCAAGWASDELGLFRVISIRARVTCNQTNFGYPRVTSSKPRSSRDKVRAHRERLRRAGLRPIQIWVPDVRSRAFASKAHRQSLAVARSAHSGEDQAFIDAISEVATT